jgi:glucose/mannose transport system substrate-binding protein
MRSSFISLRVVAGALAALAVACSDGPTQTSSLEIMHWWTKGGEHEAITALLDMYRHQNASVKVIDSGIDGGSAAARAAIRNRMSMGFPPDTFQANGGWDLMAWVLYNDKDSSLTKMNHIDDWVQDWTPHVPAQVLDSVSYTDPDAAVGTHVYAVPLNIHRLNTLFYNKALFDEIGINLADLQEREGLFKVAEQIRQYNQTSTKPITPIALGYGEKQTWTLALVFFENLLVARMGGDWYTDLFQKPKVHDAFSADITYALEDFRRLISYTNDDASQVTWDVAMDRVLNGDAAMTIMGDWGKGYANANHFDGQQFGFMPMPGTAGTFVFTTDTFGLPIGADHPENTEALLRLAGSPDGQKIFNLHKGSISARLDVEIDADDDRRPIYDDFRAASTARKIVQATSILAQQTYMDAVSAALASFASKGQDGVASEVQHTMDNYSDILRNSCWPHCQTP